MLYNSNQNTDFGNICQADNTDVFSNKFLEAVPLLRIFSLTFLTSALISMNISFLNAVNKTKVNITISVSLIPIYALLAFFLIKKYDLIGFAVSILMIEVLFFAIRTFFVRNYF